MAKSYALLSRENWTDVSLGELVEVTLTPFGLDRVFVEGPATRMRPRQTLSVGLALHELATNAGKYGALSVPVGRLSLTWSLAANDGNQLVEIVWREEKGPKLRGDPHRGFGLKLVERETEYNLRGSARIEFPEDGLITTLRFPLSEEDE